VIQTHDGSHQHIVGSQVFKVFTSFLNFFVIAEAFALFHWVNPSHKRLFLFNNHFEDLLFYLKERRIIDLKLVQDVNRALTLEVAYGGICTFEEKSPGRLGRHSLLTGANGEK
jgi:hypothetical protein